MLLVEIKINMPSCSGIYIAMTIFQAYRTLEAGYTQEQDKSSDIEQQSPLGDRKNANIFLFLSLIS